MRKIFGFCAKSYNSIKPSIYPLNDFFSLKECKKQNKLLQAGQRKYSYFGTVIKTGQLSHELDIGGTTDDPA